MDRYVVSKKLGTGTYGSAYIVSLRANPAQQYVLKKVKVEGGDVSADGEVRVLKNLNHPLVLAYVDHFMYKGHLCIVTEYCDAGDLYQLLRARKSAMPEHQLLDLFAQVLLAIQHVHSKSILHRDLKTQNIFLTSSGSIRLGDFGISRPLNGTMDLASTIIGTPYYMSPEVMSSMPYDYKSDMWSLGCVLYEMMSLKHAFDAADMSSLVMKILRGEHLPIPQGYSQELKDLVRQLLCKNPKMRPSPDQIMKMPVMKEYVARARETVALLDGRSGGAARPAAAAAAAGGGARRAEPGLPSGPVAMHRHSYSVGVGEAGCGSGGGIASSSPSTHTHTHQALDRELDAAKERLRRIQLEREALMKQGSGAPSGPASGRSSPPGRYHRHSTSSAPTLPPHPPPLSGQASEPSLGQPAGAGAGAGGAGRAGAAGAAEAALRGKSWRDKDEALQRLQARRSQRELPLPPPAPRDPPPAAPPNGSHGPAAAHRTYPGLSGDVDALLERHREARQLRNSRPQSPDHPANGGLAGSPPGGAGADHRSRMRARKEEEARRREAELLNARKAYFEERKQAATRLQQLYNTSSSSASHLATNRRATESSPHGSGEYQQHHHSSPHHQHQSSSMSIGGYDGALGREPSGLADGGSGPYGMPNSYGGANLAVLRSGVSDSDDDLDLYGEGGALQEFEAELSSPPGHGAGGGGGGDGGLRSSAAPQQQLQAALDKGGLAERIMALREVCAFNLGQPLYELIYGYIRKRMAQGVHDDPAFRSELLSRLGGGKMQYVHIIDQLIYFEDMQGLQAGLM